MVRKLIVTIFSLCLTAVLIFSADAQQNPPNVNPKFAQIQQLRQEILGLRQQLEPLRSKMKDLVGQIQAVREQSDPIEEKIKADNDQLHALLGEHH